MLQLTKPIIHVGWSISEELLCIEDDGSVLKYDLFGNHKHTFSIGEVCTVDWQRNCSLSLKTERILTKVFVLNRKPRSQK